MYTCNIYYCTSTALEVKKKKRRRRTQKIIRNGMFSFMMENFPCPLKYYEAVNPAWNAQKTSPTEGDLLFSSLGLSTPVVLVTVKKSFFLPCLIFFSLNNELRPHLDFSCRSQFHGVPFQEPESCRGITSNPESSRTDSVLLRCWSSPRRANRAFHAILTSSGGARWAVGWIAGHSSLLKQPLRSHCYHPHTSACEL